MTKLQERLNSQGQQYITDLAATVRQLWKAMCNDVGIPENTSFVDMELLKQSKFYPFHEKAMYQYFEAVNTYRCGGYVGLQIKSGKSK